MNLYSMLVVDDEYLVRVGIKETISWKDHHIEIIGEADSGKSGLEIALKTKPDLIITDVRMPDMDGLEFLKAVKTADLNSVVIVLSGYEEFEYVRTAMRSGAFAYLLKPIDNNELLNTVLDGIKEIQKSRRTLQHYSRLKEELSSVKRHFLTDLFTGKIKDMDKIQEKLELYNIDIYPKDNYALYLTVNSSSQMLQSTQKDSFVAMKNEMNRLIVGLINRNNISAVYTDLSELEWMIIINTSSVDKPIKTVKLELKRILEDFEKIMGYTCSVGISNVFNDLSQISYACKEAQSYVSMNSFTHINRVISADTVDNNVYSKKINEAIKYITAYYAKDISVESVANALYISPSYLMHLFKDNLGKTFNECLTETRINAARELLNDPKYKVYEVCYKVGYKDIKYFSQIFKRSTGMTPSEYSKGL